MSTKLRRRGWLAVGLAVLTGTALVALAPKLGYSRTGPAQLWSDEPPKVSSQTVPAPDWVTIAKTLKPAVVNVSTKRMESGPVLPKGLDPDDPFAQFFRQFDPDHQALAPHFLHFGEFPQFIHEVIAHIFRVGDEVILFDHFQHRRILARHIVVGRGDEFDVEAEITTKNVAAPITSAFGLSERIVNAFDRGIVASVDVEISLGGADGIGG